MIEEVEMPEKTTCPPKVDAPKVYDGYMFSRKADILKVIAHPIRIMVLDELTRGVKCVSDLAEFLEISQPNISQHLSLLRNNNIIDYYMDGRLRCYFLKDPLMPDLLKLLKKDYNGDLPAPACCPITKKGKYPGGRSN